MSNELSLIAEDVHITYRTYLDPQADLRHRLKSGRGAAKRRHIDVEAVRGVSFDLRQGESIGFVGHNGAGKSTIMLGLAGLLELNGGRVLARSRPRLLGVGSVLNTNLSGRRNIEIGCLAMGMAREAVADRMDHLIEFSGLREFIDLPLKAYSSGMRARLSFTVATVSEPEVLLIDEALAVGDVDFRQKATQRIEEIREAAGSVIVVSHNTAELGRMCDRIIWLDKGRIVRDGTPGGVLRLYSATRANPDLLEGMVSTDIAGIGPLRSMTLATILSANHGEDQVTESTPGDHLGDEPAVTVDPPVASDLDDATPVQQLKLAKMLANCERPPQERRGAILRDWMIDHPSGALMMEWHSPTEPRQAILLAETGSPWFKKWRSGWDESEDGYLSLDQQPPSKDLPHDLVYCSTRFPEAFTHWWIDVAARVHLALGSPEFDGLRFLLPADQTKLQLDALAAIGLTEDRIYTPTSELERIHTIRFLGSLQYGPRAATAVSPLALEAANSARERVLPTGPPATGRRLYVTRRTELSRRVRNEAEVEAAMSALGFEIVVPSEMTFAETVATFAGASVVAGASGDGLSNVIFSDPGTAVIEVLPDTFTASHVRALSSLAHHRYALLAGRAFGDGRESSEAAVNDNLRVPVDRLTKLIEELAPQQ